MNLKIHARTLYLKNKKVMCGWGKVPIKYLLIMKLILFLTLGFCLHVSATALGQNVTLSVKEGSFRMVLRSIQQQSGYSFMITRNLIEKAKPVTLDVQGKDVKEILPILFKDQPFTYEVSGKLIRVMPKSETNLQEESLDPTHQQTLHGRVTDSVGRLLEGVTVQLIGTLIRTSTDKNGQYELSGVPVGATLLFRLLSYEPQEVFIDRAEINVVMKFTSSLLDEPVVIAYGTTTRRLNTGSVSTLKAENIQKQPVSDPLLTLQGRIPGLYIAQASGVPGARIGSIRLRGQNSIANGNDPLFLIDGIPYSSNSLTSTSYGGGAAFLSPFNALDPADIESIEVLKDADATAIYGSRGANGVILITTKRGKAGKTMFDINAYQGFSQISNRLDLMNTREYLIMRREAFKNDGITTYPANAYDINGSWDTTRYTDWQDVFIGGTAKTSDLRAAISGGNNNTHFLFSSGYRQETTVYPGSFSDSKISLKANINHQTDNRKFNFQLSTSYLVNDSRIPSSDMMNDVRLPPNAPSLYDSDGNLNWENGTFVNPMALLLKTADAMTNNLLGSFTVNYNITNNLSLKSSFGYNKIEMKQSKIEPMSSFRPSFHHQSFRRRNEFPNSQRSSWIIEPQLTYEKRFNRLQLNMLIGTTFQEDQNESISQVANDFINDELIGNPRAAAFYTISSYAFRQYRYNAVFARANFNLMDKYILNVTGRRDGSSRFGENNKFGNFGAVGIAWLFSNEDFIKNNILGIAFGKVRASFGSTGNDQISDYQYLSSYTTYNVPYQDAIGLYPIRIANSNYGWERVNKLEAGLDLGIWSERMLFDLSYYDNRTSNQLVGYSLPVITGFPSVTANLPAVIRNWGWELGLNSQNIKSDNINWNTSISISFPRNKLLSYPSLESSSYANRYEVGKSLFIQKKLRYIGVDPKLGIYTFEDFDSDGHISVPNDYQGIKEVKQRFHGGLHNNISYQGFELDFFIQFVKQTGYNFYYTYNVLPGSANNQHGEMSRRWQAEGENSEIQKFTQLSNSPAGVAFRSMINTSDLIISDASFIRFKNLAFSYNISKSALRAVKLTSLRIYLQGQNLFTFTNYYGLDPESQSNFLPPLKVYSLGFRLTI